LHLFFDDLFVMHVDSIARKLLLLLIFIGSFGYERIDAQNRRRNSSEEILTRSLLDQGDENEDGALALDEWNVITQRWFARLDAGGQWAIESGGIPVAHASVTRRARWSGGKRSRSMIPSKFLEFL
jgi:hypothetical protein